MESFVNSLKTLLQPVPQQVNNYSQQVQSFVASRLKEASQQALRQPLLNLGAGPLAPKIGPTWGQAINYVKPVAKDIGSGILENFSANPSPSAQRGQRIIQDVILGGGMGSTSPAMGAVAGNEGFIARQALGKVKVGGAKAIQAVEEATKIAQSGGLQAGKINLGAKIEPFAEEANLIRQAKGLSAQDIMTKHPNINLKRDVPVTDVYGVKKIIPEGEALTPYELKGNKVLLQDGETYIVSKNQYQNIKGQSVSGGAKEFAPELKGTEEVVKGNPTEAELTKQGFWFQENPEGSPYKWSLMNNKNESVMDANSIETIKRDLPISQYNASPTKYQQYQLPGGENYREVLIQAPNKKSAITEMEKAGYKFVPENGRIRLVQPNGQDIGLWPTKDSAAKSMARDYGTDFKSSHWDEPNVISHLRLNERTYQGKKVTFMEELQSDWAGAGRKEGFTNPEQITIAKKKLLNFENEMKKKYNENFAGPALSAHMTPVEAGTWVDLHAAAHKTGVPNNPLLKNWQELSVKRGLKEAVDNNSEYLSWTTGEQQAARYNLSKQVDNISWNKSVVVNGEKTVVLNPKGSSGSWMFDVTKDGTIQNTAGGAPAALRGKKLDAAIGKGLAEQIMGKPTGKLEGEGLNFGGEWAKNLYDRQVKSIVENLTGGRVENLNLSQGDAVYALYHKDARGSIGGGYSLDEAKTQVAKHPDWTYKLVSGGNSSQQAIRITPEIRAKVLGQAPILKQPSGLLPLAK